MKHLFALSVFGLLLFVSAPLAVAQGTYTQIDVPGAAATLAAGIDSAGDISGLYVDATIGNSHGFLLSGGTYTTIDYPGFLGTFLYGMNDVGQSVGIAFGTGVNIGFVYDTATQTFTVISYPGSDDTIPYAINNAGTIVGFYQQGHRTIGFKLEGSIYSKIGTARGISSWALGISAADDVVGGFATPNVINFILHHGKYKFVRMPNKLDSEVSAINSAGTALAGSYAPISGTGAGFVSTMRTFEELQFPGTNSTSAWGINNAGEVVGSFVDANALSHGFLWTPPAVRKR